jgi:hypothetical protein
VPDIVTAILAAMGQGEDARPALIPRVRANLGYLEKRELVARTGNGLMVSWVLRP